MPFFCVCVSVLGHLNAKEAMVKKNYKAASCTKDWRSHMVALAMDYLCVVMPVLLVFTVSMFYNI